jgi:kumamolisin
MMARTTSGKVRLAVGLGLVAAIAVSLTPAQQPPAAERKVFKNSVVPLPATGPAPQGLVVNAPIQDHKNDTMEVLFSLAIPKDARAKLEEKVLKGEVVDPKELAKDYSPKPEDAERLVKFLKDEGFEITQTTDDKTSVYAKGTVAQIEKTLQVKMVRVTKDGQTYNAAKDAPSLPADVGAGVQSVIGLQPFRQFTKKSRIHRPVNSEETADEAHAPQVPGYLVNQVLKAYNADNLGVTGDGQKIAILIDTLPHDADTKHFWTVNGLPADASRVEKVRLKRGRLPPVEGEESMDVQWSSGIAPGAKVRVYACGSLAFVDLDRGLDRILADAMADPALRQASISLGLGEQLLSPDGALDGEVAIEEDKFLKLAALGVNVFVSSGDAGSNPDATGHGTGDIQQAEWMATSPFVVGVGGTALLLNGAGTVTGESAWAGSGGGLSKVFDRPSYQKQVQMGQAQKRLVPDVSLLAAPETGGYVRVNGHDLQIGGTSLSAPVWAGFCALMNEARTKANKPTLPFLNPIIYPMAGGNNFRDIKGGSNGAFNADLGYDMVTGLGVPHVKNLTTELTK